MSDIAEGWIESNQRQLVAALARVRRALEQRVGQRADDVAPSVTETALSHDAAPEPTTPPSALARLGATFGLSPFERDVLVLCAGMELDASFGSLCASAQGDPSRSYPTFSLALAALEGAHWSALTPAAPLRRWRLIDVAGDQPLTQRPLRIDERILHFLAGVQHLDERLCGLVEPASAPENDLVPSHQAIAEELIQAWSHPLAGAARLQYSFMVKTRPASGRSPRTPATRWGGISTSCRLAPFRWLPRSSMHCCGCWCGKAC